MNACTHCTHLHTQAHTCTQTETITYAHACARAHVWIDDVHDSLELYADHFFISLPLPSFSMSLSLCLSQIERMDFMCAMMIIIECSTSSQTPRQLRVSMAKVMVATCRVALCLVVSCRWASCVSFCRVMSCHVMHVVTTRAA
jgi:hypothetical protein